MKKISIMMGYDFWLRIPVNSESFGKHLNLDRVKDLFVFLEGAYGGVWSLKWERDGAQHNGIAVKVEADELPLGTYAVMMTGRTVNDDPFRIKRNLFIRLVDDPKEADARRTSYNEEKAYWAGPAVMSKMLDRDGLNAYELAVENGFKGTLEDFLYRQGMAAVITDEEMDSVLGGEEERHVYLVDINDVEILDANGIPIEVLA